MLDVGGLSLSREQSKHRKSTEVKSNPQLIASSGPVTSPEDDEKEPTRAISQQEISQKVRSKFAPS